MTQTIDLNQPDEGVLGGGRGIQPLTKNKRKGTGQTDTGQPLKVRLETRKNQLDIDRKSWFPNWQDLGMHFRPYRGRFLMPDGSDTNKGWRRNFAIVNSTPLETNNICAAGLLAGMASPSRPWFEYKLDDDDLMEAPGVKEWLSAVTKKNRSILSRTNFYNQLFECFGEFGVFGTMALGRDWQMPRYSTEPDLPYFHAFTIGAYYIGNDSKRRVNVWFRDYQWTVQQVVEAFLTGDIEKMESWQNISVRTRALWDNGQKDTMVYMCHAIEENPYYQPGKLGWQGMRFRSVKYERGGDPFRIASDNFDKDPREQNKGKIGGFRDFPIFVARWYTNSEDAWGRGWAMDALGDARALQLQEKRLAQAIDKLVDPPMVADANLRNQRTSLLSGDTTFIAPDSNGIGFKPAYEIKPDVGALGQNIQNISERIKSLGYADIFARFLDAERSGQPITAAQVNAEQQEKLLMLGPVLEQCNYDVFNPLHEWLFANGLRHGLYPPLPPALKKATIHVNYISILAQAINAVTADANNRFVAFVGQVAQVVAEAQNTPAADKVNWDKLVEDQGTALGISPTIIRSDADVKQIRDQRSQQQAQAQQQAAAAQQAQTANTHADTASTLADTPMQDGGSALDRLAQSVGAGQVPTS